MNTTEPEQALSLHQTGQIAEAEQAYLDIILDDPGNAEALKLLGVLACQQSNFEEGITYLEAAIENDSSMAEYHLALGHAYLVTGKVEDGIASLTKAGELDPGRAEIFGALGDVFQQVVNFSEALRAYQRAIVLEPDNINFRVGAGLSAVFAGHHEAATEYLEQALTEDKTIHQIHYGLALLKAESGDKSAAAELMAKANTLEPNNPEYQRLKAEFPAA